MAKKDKGAINQIKRQKKQRIQLLVDKPNFQKDIHKLRRKWCIPKDGLKNHTEAKDWQDNFYDRDDRWFESVWLRKRIIYNKLQEEGKVLEAQKYQKKLNNSSPVNAFRIDIKEIIKTYKVPPLWFEFIRSYLLFNKLENAWIPDILVKEEWDPDTKIPRLYLEIEDWTTIEKIRRNWKYIKQHKSRLNSQARKKSQPMKQYDRDKRAFELKEQGKSNKEIAEILSEEFEGDYVYNEISKFVGRHKKKVGIN